MAEILNLVPAIQEVEAQIASMEHQFQKKIKPYKESFKALRDINEACEECGGDGKILRSRSCAEDDRPDPNDPQDWRTCPICKGTGRVKKKGT